ncbi:MAG: ATP-dependent helicase, partial [Rubrivivax sp.]
PLLDEDYLILSTIHSAKGQEWKSVHVLNVTDGGIPSDLGTGSTHELEEERRLLYVAMTRARDELHLLIPQRFFVRHIVGQEQQVMATPLNGRLQGGALEDQTAGPAVQQQLAQGLLAFGLWWPSGQ